MTLNALSQVPRRPAPADRLDVASSPRGKDQMLCIILKIQINCGQLYQYEAYTNNLIADLDYTKYSRQ